MAPTLATKWFTHAKTLECDEALRQNNWSFVRHLSDWMDLEAKDGGLYHQRGGSPCGLHWSSWSIL